jgi:hypothetical protein
MTAQEIEAFLAELTTMRAKLGPYRRHSVHRHRRHHHHHPSRRLRLRRRSRHRRLDVRRYRP